MRLADYQNDIVTQIYDLLTVDDLNKCINIIGDIGSGKTTIALSVAQLLKENWMVFYIRGVDPTLSPYLTWHIGTRLFSKKKLHFCGELSFGVNFLPVPLSIEFTGGNPKIEKTNYILTPSEEALMNSIKSQVGSNEHILFIIDDFNLWDIPSKQLLQKIIMPSLKLLPEYHVTVLVVSQEKISLSNEMIWHDIPIPLITDDNLLYILHQNGYARSINLNDIRACAGNDISLCLMAAQYYENNDVGSAPDFKEIMDRRVKSLPEQDREICKILEPLSIIDSYFSEEETAFFIDPTSSENTEMLFLAEEYLFLAQEHDFITGDKNYCFINQKIKDYFRTRLSRREKYHHKKFAEYLQRKHPEDYYSRGKHLKLSIQKNDQSSIYEAWQLLLLAYVRRASELGWQEDIYNIIDEINSLMALISPEHVETQKKIMHNFMDGYHSFSKYDYRPVLYRIQSIGPMFLTPACRAECQRLILLCYVQLAENLIMIRQTADDLFDTIHSDNFNEDEQYCRAALVLLDVYIDRFNEPTKVRQLKNTLIKLINRHLYCPEFLEFNACFNRKSALYYAAPIACRQTGESVQFYREHNNRNGLYMALCNHSANGIVSGDYQLASNALEECISLVQKSENWYYPSHYKIENNKILISYLQMEMQAAGKRRDLIMASKWALEAFKNILHCQDDEVSYVIYLNYLGFSMLCDESTWGTQLAEANKLLADTDAFYKYYLYDLNLAACLLNNDLTGAESELKKLESLDAPLLYPYCPILKKKRDIQEQLISYARQSKYDAIEYNQAVINACSHIQDPTCKFYGRGFLLSDLQFLSF